MVITRSQSAPNLTSLTSDKSPPVDPATSGSLKLSPKSAPALMDSIPVQLANGKQFSVRLWERGSDGKKKYLQFNPNRITALESEKLQYMAQKVMGVAGENIKFVSLTFADKGPYSGTTVNDQGIRDDNFLIDNGEAIDALNPIKTAVHQGLSDNSITHSSTPYQEYVGLKTGSTKQNTKKPQTDTDKANKSVKSKDPNRVVTAKDYANNPIITKEKAAEMNHTSNMLNKFTSESSLRDGITDDNLVLAMSHTQGPSEENRWNSHILLTKDALKKALKNPNSEAGRAIQKEWFKIRAKTIETPGKLKNKTEGYLRQLRIALKEGNHYTYLTIIERETNRLPLNTKQYDIIDIDSLGGGHLSLNLYSRLGYTNKDAFKVDIQNLIPEEYTDAENIHFTSILPRDHQKNGNLCGYYVMFYDKQITDSLRDINPGDFANKGFIQNSSKNLVSADEEFNTSTMKRSIPSLKSYIESVDLYNKRLGQYKSQWFFNKAGKAKPIFKKSASLNMDSVNDEDLDSFSSLSFSNSLRPPSMSKNNRYEDMNKTVQASRMQQQIDEFKKQIKRLNNKNPKLYNAENILYEVLGELDGAEKYYKIESIVSIVGGLNPKEDDYPKDLVKYINETLKEEINTPINFSNEGNDLP